MRLSIDNAYNHLHKLFNQYPDLDSASIAVKWFDYIREYEKEQIATTQRAINPKYGLVHGQHVEYADGEGSNIYQQDGQFRISRDKLDDFCKAKGVDKKKLLEVLNGEAYEFEGYRQSWFQGTLNKLYIPKRDVKPDEIPDNEFKVRYQKRSPIVPVEIEEWS